MKRKREQMSVDYLLETKQSTHLPLEEHATRTQRMRTIIRKHTLDFLAHWLDWLPYVYLRSVLLSSRIVIDRTTRTQPTAHTSNRVAYSLSDPSGTEEMSWKG